MWYVGREGSSIYVSDHGSVLDGEVDFNSEEEALRYAIDCCDDHIQTLRGSRRDAAARLRALKRKAK